MEAPLDISAPLPIVREDAPAWILSATMANQLVRKVEAFSNIQAEPPLKIIKSDSGFRIVDES